MRGSSSLNPPKKERMTSFGDLDFQYMDVVQKIKSQASGSSNSSLGKHSLQSTSRFAAELAASNNKSHHGYLVDEIHYTRMLE